MTVEMRHSLPQKGLSMRWMTLPAIGFVLAMIVFPFLYAGWLALNDFVFGSSMRFTGAGNFSRLAHDPEFVNALGLTFLLYAVSLAMQLVLGTWLALVLNRVERLRGLVRTVAISPFMLPPVVIGMMAIVIFDPSFGIANWLLGEVGLGPRLWLSNPEWAILTVAVIDTWQWTPFVALIVLGGLQALPQRVFEAAEVDGAVGWLRFFDIIYITTRGGPGIATQTVNIFAYRRGFEFLDIGYASAAMIILSLIVLVTVLAFARLRRALAW